MFRQANHCITVHRANVICDARKMMDCVHFAPNHRVAWIFLPACCSFEDVLIRLRKIPSGKVLTSNNAARNASHSGQRIRRLIPTYDEPMILRAVSIVSYLSNGA